VVGGGVCRALTALLSVSCWILALVVVWGMAIRPPVSGMSSTWADVLLSAYFGIGPAVVSTSCLLLGIRRERPARYLIVCIAIFAVAFGGIALGLALLGGS
jgi:hypothetical protein